MILLFLVDIHAGQFFPIFPLVLYLPDSPVKIKMLNTETINILSRIYESSDQKIFGFQNTFLHPKGPHMSQKFFKGKDLRKKL